MKIGDRVTLKNDTPIHNHVTHEHTGEIPAGTRGTITEQSMKGDTLYWFVQLDEINTVPLPYLNSVFTKIFTIEEV